MCWKATTVGTVTATDADLPTQTISYSLTGGVDQAKFLITSGGFLSFATAPDYENPDDSGANRVYNVTVTADDGNGRTTSGNITVTVTAVNDNSPVFTSATTFNVAENTTHVVTMAATDADLPAQTITYSVVGGVDQSKFTVTSGVLRFITAPNYEAPTDSGGNNVYEVQVRANDGNGGLTVQSIAVTVTPVNDNAPVFTSAANVNVAENSTAVVTLAATDADLPAQTITYSLTGGVDQAKFSLVGSALSFIAPPDFENPTDAGSNNVYNVQVMANDGSGSTTVQNIAVTVTNDLTMPTLVILPGELATNADSVTFTFQFGRAVDGFTVSDIALTNGSGGTFTVIDSDTYTLVVSPIADGAVVVAVDANSAQDNESNGNLAASTSIISDRTAPTINITPNAITTSANPITFTFQFNEVVTGFVANDISLTNGTPGTFTAVDGDTYTLQVIPTAAGTVSVSVQANVAQDGATNGNVAANASVTGEPNAVPLNITPNGTLTNASPVLFTFQFNVAVTGFTVSDIGLTNGTAGTFTAVDGDTYTLAVTPGSDGTVAVNVAASVVQDGDGNGNAAAGASVTSDRTSPTLNITPQSILTNASPIVFTFQFSESMTGFAANDISITNGTAGTFTAVAGDTYTLQVIPAADGSVGVSVAANRAQDAATNGNLAASATVTSDRTAPTLAITPNGITSNANPIVFTFQFGETVTGFAAGDVSVTNGTKGTFTPIDGDTYTLQVFPTTPGTVSVSMPADAAQDAATNGNLAAGASVNSDPNAVTLSITPNATVTNANPILFTFQFNVSVTGFTASDVGLVNGTAGTFTAVDGDTYTLAVTPLSEDAVVVSVAANVAQDSVSNGNNAASASVTFDQSPPFLSIIPPGPITNASPILFWFQFTEPVTGFAVNDITITNGTAGAFVILDSLNYTLDVTPSVDGLVGVSVAANRAQDAATNGNLAQSISVTSDRTAPALTITPNGTTSNSNAITFTFQFSEAVTGFNLGDVSLTNGVAGTFAVVDADTYTLAVTASGTGPVSVNVGANTALDQALNGNTAANATVTYDPNAVSLSISPNAVVTNASPIVFTFQFNVSVSGFATNDVVITNGTAGTFTIVDADTYTLAVTPTANGTVSVSVSANAAQDTALNGNVSASASVTSDRTAPSLSITPNATTTNAATILFTFQFTEPVTGFAASDISITNGAAGTFTVVDGDTYTLAVTPASDGAVGVNVGANVAQDVATNPNLAASASVTSDRTVPGLTITPNGLITNANSILFTFQFTEVVTGFTLGDIGITNGTAGTFTAVDGDTYTLVVTPIIDLAVTVNVAANVAQDGATNGNPAASASIVSDRTGPSVGISPNGQLTNAAVYTFTIQFSEAVTGLTAADFSVINGTAGTFTAVDADTYTIQVMPASDGVVTLIMAGNAAQDGAQNGSLAWAANFHSDRTRPTVNITPNGTLTGASHQLFILQFSEPLTGFNTSDISITNGSFFSFTPIDADTYHLTVAVGSDGPLTVSIAADGGQDPVGNGNLAGSATLTVDHTPPGLTITPNASATSASPILFTFQFTETVSDFVVSDIGITNGSAGTFTAVDGDTYTLAITPAADGVVSVSVPLFAARDAAFNSNVPASASVTSDRTIPTLNITPNGGTINSAVVTYTIQFSEPITGFTVGDIALSNGTAGTFTAVDGDTYTLSVNPDADGPVSASVAANAAQDAAGNGHLAASASVIVDRSIPGLNITPNAVVTNASPILFTFQFTEAVAGFTVGDITLSNGTAAAFTVVDGDTYTLQVTPASNGAITVIVAASVAQDGAANGNTAASAAVTSDRSAPTAAITPIAPDPRTTAVGSVVIQFSEAVTGFDLIDLSLTRDGGSNLLTGSQTLTTLDNVTFTLTNLGGLTGAAGSYLIRLTASGSGIQDAAGNSLQVNPSDTWARITPTVTLGIDNGSIAETAGVASITATLSAVTDVDVTVNLGFTGSAAFPGDYARSATQIVIPAGSTSGTVTVTAASDGDLETTESILIGVNSVLNGSESGTQEVTTQIVDDDHVPVFGSPASVSVPENSTAVMTVSATDADIPAQTLTYTLSSGPDQSKFSITAGGVLTFINPPNFEVPSDAGVNNVYNVQVRVNDGHGGIATQNLAITVTNVDEIPPTVSLETVTPDPRNSSIDAINITFSEPVSGFDLSDLVLTRNGGTNLLNETQALSTLDNLTFTLSGLGNVTGVDGEYLLSVAPTSSGIVDVTGNALANGATEGWMVDATAPSGSITAVTPDPRATAVTSLTIMFTEPVSGFDVRDLVLTRDGGANLLTGLEALTTSDNMTFVLNNLGSLTAPVGNYALSLNTLGSEIQDAVGNVLATVGVETWSRTNPSVTLSSNNTVLVEAGGTTTITATLSVQTDVNVVLNLAFSGQAGFPGDYSRSAGSIVIAVGSTTGSITLTSIQDGELEGNEGVLIEIGSVTNGAEQGTQQVTLQIVDDDHAPSFVTTATPSIQENSTAVLLVAATDADVPAQTISYSITGGIDQGLFSITANGQLSFVAPPDFESPADNTGDNIYEVTVRASDGHGGTASQNLSVTVTNVNEAPQLDLVGGAVTWIRKQPAVVVLPQISVGGQANLTGGTLTLSVNVVGTTKKVFDTFTIPSGSGLGSTSGPQVANGQLTLQIELKEGVTTQSIQSFLRGITFSTKGKGFKTLTRSLAVTLSNSVGGTDSVTQTINVRKKA